MSCNPQYELCAVQGDTLQKVFTLSAWNPATEAFEPVDLTGVVPSFNVARRRGEPPAFELGNPDITVTNPEGGQVTLSVPPGTTSQWGYPDAETAFPAPTAARWAYSVRLVWPDAYEETIMSGVLCVELAVA